MKVLAIDTSSNVASAAILEDDKLIAEYTLNHKKTHSQKIMPMVEEIMRSCECSVSDIDVFAAVHGPGSFTGLRIGVATIKALAHVAGKPVVGISSLEAMAYQLPHTPYWIVPIMDARRGQVYNGIYAWENDRWTELTAPRALAMEECIEEIKRAGRKAVFLGDGVPVHRELIEATLREQAMFAPAFCVLQRAATVAQLALERAKRGDTQSYLELVPFYLRKSQAEREYLEKETHKHDSNRK